VGPVAAPRRYRAAAVEALLVAGLLAAVPLVHRPGPLLAAPYWLDESWVAVSARAPLGQLPWVTASTPLGWTLLVHGWPAGQSARLVPLAFLAGTVLAGYALGRGLGWPGRGTARVAGVAAALAALLLPAQQDRHDLKQYTADAAAAVALLALCARAEARTGPAGRGRPARTGAGLGLAIGAAMLVSHVAALAGVAVLVAVTARAAIGRYPWRALAALAGTAVPAMAAVYLLADRAGRTGALSAYWAGWFPSPGRLPGYLVARFGALTPALGLPWPAYLALAGLGVAVLARYGRPATALAAGTLPVLAVAAGVAGRYPLLEQRTSHGLLVTGAVLGGLGLAGAGHATARALLGPGRPAVVTLAVVLALAFGGYALANAGALARPPVPGQPGEDVRAQVGHLARYRRPGDVVLVNMSGQYGFGWYWPGPAPRFVPGATGLAIGWRLRYPDGDRIVIAAGRDPASVAQALRSADELARGPGGTGRIWLVRSHLDAAEALAWSAALAGRSVVTVPVGVEPLALLPG